MSYLGIALQRIAKKNNLPQRAVSKKSGVSSSEINRMFSGAQQFVNDEDFAAILGAISPNLRERGEIVAERCRDVCNGPGSELVVITVKGERGEGKKEKDPVIVEGSKTKLSHEHERALAFIRSQIPLNPALGDMIIAHARALGLKKGE